MRSIRWRWLAVVSVVTFFSPTGAANPKFPATLAEKLHMPCSTPSCRVCHGTEEGGLGNFRTISLNGQMLPGFGQHLMSICGLDGRNENSLEDIWPCVMSEGQASDLDMDGKPDLQELAIGQDPNSPTYAPVCEGPVYGCLHVARGGPVDDVAATTALVVALAGISALRRRR